MAGIWLIDLRVAADFVVFQCDLPAVRIVSSHPVSPVVAVAAVLGDSRSGFKLTGVRPDAQIESTEIESFTGLDGSNRPAAVPVGDVEPAIESPDQSIPSMLLVSPAKSFVKKHPEIRFAIASGVAQEPDVGRCDREDTIAPGKHGVGGLETVREESALVVAPISVGIGKSDNSAPGLALVIEAHWIISHLGHPQTTVRAPRHVDRIHDERFGCH